MNKFLARNKNQFLVLVSVVIIIVGIIVSALIFSNSNIYIKNLGSSLEQNGVLVNTISVSGDGKVFAKPDTVNLSINISELESTSSKALASLNTKTNDVLAKLKSNGILDSAIQTTQFNINPEYDYTNSGSVLKGQRASTTITAKIENVKDDIARVGKVIDEVSGVQNISIGSISFDIADKTELFTKARELAYNKAKQKAEELSGLSSTKLLSPVSISDATYDITPLQPYTNFALSKSADSVASSTSIQSGELEVSVLLNVVFGIE